MQHKNSIENAQNFLAQYQTKEQINYGTAIYLLDGLMEIQENCRQNYAFNALYTVVGNNGKKQIYSNGKELNQLIIDHKEELKKLDLSKYFLNKNEIDFFSLYKDLQKCVDPKNTLGWIYPKADRFNEIGFKEDFLAFNQRFKRHFLDKISEENTHRECGAAHALYQDLGLAKASDDLYQHVQKPSGVAKDVYKRKAQGGIYLVDAGFKEWPINKIGNLNLYAAKGFQAEDRKGEKAPQHPGNFFHAVIKTNGLDIVSKKEEVKKIHIIALGETEVDFPGYFSHEGSKDYALSPGLHKTAKSITILPQTQKSSQNANSRWNDHQLYCYYNDNNNTVYNGKSYAIYVRHVPNEDMQPVKMSEEESSNFYNDINKWIEDGEHVFVHCKSGLGRTGEVIASILLQRNLPDILKDKNPETIKRNLRTFVERDLRAYRHGLILTPPQLWNSVVTANRQVAKTTLVQTEKNAKKSAYPHEVVKIDLSSPTPKALTLPTVTMHEKILLQDDYKKEITTQKPKNKVEALDLNEFPEALLSDKEFTDLSKDAPATPSQPAVKQTSLYGYGSGLWNAVSGMNVESVTKAATDTFSSYFSWGKK